MDFKIDKNVPLTGVIQPDTTTTPVPPRFMGKLPINPETGLNSREEKFVEAVVHNDNKDVTDIVQEIYAEEGTIITRDSARSRKAELRKKSSVMAVLEEYEKEAQANIVEIAKYSKTLGKMGGKDGAAYANVALAANDKILDRVHGKAKQSIDVTTRSVSINMDLTQALPEGE